MAGLAVRRKSVALLLCAASGVLQTSPSAAQQSESALFFDPTRLTLQQSFNDFTTPAHAYTSETELAYRATDWYQVSVAVPASLGGTTTDPAGSPSLRWSGLTIRNSFITPHAGEQKAFLGLTMQFAYNAPGNVIPPVAATNSRFTAALTPLIGFNHEGYQLLLDPTVGFGIGAGAITSLAPAARLTRTIVENVDVGIEYNGLLGPATATASPGQQTHIVYGVTDFGLGGYNFNVGVGYGLNAASRGLALKLAVSHGL